MIGLLAFVIGLVRGRSKDERFSLKDNHMIGLVLNLQR